MKICRGGGKQPKGKFWIDGGNNLRGYCPQCGCPKPLKANGTIPRHPKVFD